MRHSVVRTKRANMIRRIPAARVKRRRWSSFMLVLYTCVVCQVALWWPRSLCVAASSSSSSATDDLYALLGVARSATTKEIKAAYRRKALDTHPDKNQSENAAELFRQVVDAFEILSDPDSRRRYDRTGRTDQAHQQQQHNTQHGGNGWSHFHFHFHHHYRPPKLKDQRRVQEAMARIMHVVSLAQLETVMLNDDGLLERNLLVVVVTPGMIDEHVQDEICFPYPFAAMSEQGIWWEDILQTAKIRLYRSNELQRALGIPHGDELHASKQPLFLFGRRGSRISTDWPRMQTFDRQTFETWVWKQIEVPLVFENQHDVAVEVYWIHGTRAQLKLVLQPGEQETHTSMLTHQWYVRDINVDARPEAPGRHRLSDSSALLRFTVLDDQNRHFVIRTLPCVDASGHCAWWRAQGECHNNPNFMAEACRRTCEVCSQEDNNHQTRDPEEREAPVNDKHEEGTRQGQGQETQDEQQEEPGSDEL